MRLKITQKPYGRGCIVAVALSRRNLQTLLNKLDDPTSLKTLLKTEDDGDLVVTAEDDEAHYDRPEGGPGRVNPKHDPTIMRTKL